MVVAVCSFWACLLLIAHTYVLYPAFLFVAGVVAQARRDWRYLAGRQERRAPALAADSLPGVSILIPAYNEEAHLPAKLVNLQALEYPRDRLEVIFVSDGSTDGTNEILHGLDQPQVRTLVLPARGGKATALNHAVEQAKHEILVFSDAATEFAPDAVQRLARHFRDPGVGAVCGALRFRASAESRHTEGVYWSYECMLRLMEGRLGATLTASGALYALRRACYAPLPADTIVEDLLVPMNARRLGYRVLYDPEAIGTDYAASTVAGEFTRRVRVATGSFRALRQLVGIPLGPMTTFALFSHKFLRWILPFLLLGLLVASAVLWERPLYRGFLIAQVLFYAWAAIGFGFRTRLSNVRYALIAYYLTAIHVAYLVGFYRFAIGRRGATWQRVS
ncbi:MAG TPA: glycosyltransferase family 2 protein [Methylomirabilota bacterium]|nr:glycosyltransferase family 2 protein [Methylomirabilota bacterium]